MISAPLPANEKERLEALLRYDILDTAFEKAYDDLVSLAANICEVPIALISLVDPDRQWFKAVVGVDARQTPRDIAFCAHAILQKEPLIVNDATKDVRFADNPLVASDPNIRFYAGVPLVTPDNFALGTLCTIDRVPRELSEHQIDALKTLANQVMTQLELRRTFSALQQSANQLRRSNASKDKFIALLTRDLRTPFTNVIGFAQLLGSGYETLDREQIGAFSKEIQSAAQSTSNLLDSLLQWSKVESGNIDFNPQALSLDDIVSDAVNSVGKAAGSKHIEIIVSNIPDTKVMADRHMVHFLVHNLLRNAVKFSHENAKVRLDVERQGDHVSVSVSDTGVGMSPEQISRLFSIETARTTEGTAGESGSGLDLLVGQKYAESHGSRLNVKSAVGKGTSVSFELPLAE